MMKRLAGSLKRPDEPAQAWRKKEALRKKRKKKKKNNNANDGDGDDDPAENDRQ